MDFWWFAAGFDGFWWLVCLFGCIMVYGMSVLGQTKKESGRPWNLYGFFGMRSGEWHLKHATLQIFLESLSKFWGHGGWCQYFIHVSQTWTAYHSTLNISNPWYVIGYHSQTSLAFFDPFAFPRNGQLSHIATPAPVPEMPVATALVEGSAQNDLLTRRWSVRRSEGLWKYFKWLNCVRTWLREEVCVGVITASYQTRPIWHISLLYYVICYDHLRRFGNTVLVSSEVLSRSKFCFIVFLEHSPLLFRTFSVTTTPPTAFRTEPLQHPHLWAPLVVWPPSRLPIDGPTIAHGLHPDALPRTTDAWTSRTMQSFVFWSLWPPFSLVLLGPSVLYLVKPHQGRSIKPT